MSKKPISAQQIQKKLGVRFRKPKLLEASLQHPSYRNEYGTRGLENFDRLEFYGDSILNFVICRKLFKIFPIDNEGMLSRLRSILVSRKILFRVAKDLGFLKWIRLGKSLKGQPEALKGKLLADCFESFIAALYLDQGFKKTEGFILKHFEDYFSIKRLFRLDPNPKSMLQELCQKKWQKLPVYETNVLPAGVKTVITSPDKKRAVVLGKTRRQSEERAARLLIKKLRQDFLVPAKRVSSGKKLRRTR